MICPHCGKEVESYTVYGQGATLKYEDGTGGDVFTYGCTVAMAGETSSSVLDGITLTPALNVSQEVTLGQPTGHYHMI